MSASDSAPRGHADDLVEVAAGGAIAFGGSLVNRALRALLAWLLAMALSPGAFGAYAWATSIVGVASAFAPLGMQHSLVYFGARYGLEERPRLKGLLISAVIIGVFASGACALVFIYASSFFEDSQATAIFWAGPITSMLALLLLFSGGIRACRDVRRYTQVNLIVAPGAITLGGLLVWLVGAGLEAALFWTAIGYGVSALLAAKAFWSHYGALLRDRAIRPRFEICSLLRYALPQSLAVAVYRFNLAVDLVMLGVLAPMEEAAVYKIAVVLAMIGQAPVSALQSIFNPLVASIIETGDRPRLRSLLHTVTRWMTVLVVPVYLGLAILPDVPLACFDERYSSAASPLLILILGRAVTASISPAAQLIPMSGRSTLGFVNGLVVLGVNFGMNWWLIPAFGAEGAALASATSLLLWSVIVAIASRWTLGLWPMDRPTGTLVGGAALAGLICVPVILNAAFSVRAAAYVAGCSVVLLIMRRWASAPADREVVDRLLQLFRRRPRLG